MIESQKHMTPLDIYTYKTRRNVEKIRSIVVILRPTYIITPPPPPPPFVRLCPPHSSASAILGVCNFLWTWLLDRRNGTDKATQGGIAASPGDGVEFPLALDLEFCRRAIQAVNGMVGLGLGPRWKPKRMGGAVARAVAFLEDREVFLRRAVAVLSYIVCIYYLCVRVVILYARIASTVSSISFCKNYTS